MPLSPKQQTSNLLPVSPVGSGFVPRAEFRPDAPVPSTYSLLAFSNSNAIRLTNFPDDTVRLLNSVLGARKLVRELKQSPEHKLVKFVLNGKPWTTPKNIECEALLMEVLTAILSQGYHFLSTVDYAKEAGDILSVIFSRPICETDRIMNHVPFGISFVSGSVIRVVNAPLGRAPGILRSVREAWPRGVTNERKVGRSVYEFKLKGYGLFQEDTFYEDTVTTSLTLLSSLALHGFNLLTSLSFTPGRSGVKDLWIFVGTDVTLGSAESHDDLLTADISSSPMPHSRNASMDGYQSDGQHSSGSLGHIRNATAPAALLSPMTSGPSETSLLRGLTSAFAEPAPRPAPLAAIGSRSPRSPRSPLSQLVSLPDDDTPTPGLHDTEWDESSPDVPVPLLDHSPSSEEDGSLSPSSARLATLPQQSVRIANAPSTISQFAPIEEAPDIRATQILYATPPPPRLNSSKTIDSADIHIPGGPAPF